MMEAPGFLPLGAGLPGEQGRHFGTVAEAGGVYIDGPGGRGDNEEEALSLKSQSADNKRIRGYPSPGSPSLISPL